MSTSGFTAAAVASAPSEAAAAEPAAVAAGSSVAAAAEGAAAGAAAEAPPLRSLMGEPGANPTRISVLYAPVRLVTTLLACLTRSSTAASRSASSASEMGAAACGWERCEPHR